MCPAGCCPDHFAPRGVAPTILLRGVLPRGGPPAGFCPEVFPPASNPDVEVPAPAGNAHPTPIRRGGDQDIAKAEVWRTIARVATRVRYLGVREVPARSVACLDGRAPPPSCAKSELLWPNFWEFWEVSSKRAFRAAIDPRPAEICRDSAMVLRDRPTIWTTGPPFSCARYELLWPIFAEYRQIPHKRAFPAA